MQKLFKPNRLLLFALPLVLSAVIIAELSVGNYGLSAESTPDSRDYPPLPGVQSFELPPLSHSFVNLLNRPFNVPDRRQPPPANTQPTSAPLTASEALKDARLELLGVALTRNKHIALIRDLASGTILSIHAGQQIKGLELSSISADRIVLKRGEETDELLIGNRPGN